MALFSWLARGLAARPGREDAVGPKGEVQRLLTQKAPDRAAVGPTVALPAIGGVPGSRPIAGTKVVGKDSAAAGPRKEGPSSAAPDDGDPVELPLSHILESVPLVFLAGDAERLVASPEAQKGSVRLPLRRLLAQLPSGRIEFRFGDLKGQIPGQFLAEDAEGSEPDEVLIHLDLAEIVKRLPSPRLERRHDQIEVLPKAEAGVPDLIVRPVKQPVEGPLRETARLAMAASSMPIVPGSALGLDSAVAKGAQGPGKVPRITEEPKKEILLSGAVPEAAPGAEPVSAVQPLFVRRTPPKPVVLREPFGGGGGVRFQPTATPAKTDRPVIGPSAVGPTKRKDEAPLEPTVQRAVGPMIQPLAPSPVSKRESLPFLARVERPKAMPVARSPGAGAGSSLLANRPIPRAREQPPIPRGERASATGALARWLGVGPGRDILIREIPGILTRLPGVSGAILSDSEALTVARELPPGIPEEAISSSASLLYKRLRHVAKELGGGFTNQTLVGLGQWNLLITCEPPFFLTTVHPTHVVPERLSRRIRKVASALARLEKARPVG